MIFQNHQIKLYTVKRKKNENRRIDFDAFDLTYIEKEGHNFYSLILKNNISIYFSFNHYI